MVVCLSCTLDAIPRNNPFLSSGLGFGSQEAIILLQKCNNVGQIKQIHAKIIRNGISNDQLLVRKFINLYSCYGRMDYADLLFHQILVPQTFTWNLMIRAHTINGSSEQALLLYNLMICEGFPPDKFTFPFVIKACTASFAVEKGKEVHGLAIKAGFSGDMFLKNTLMDFYFKCGNVNCGRRVFDKMRVRNVVSWTTMITGLVACGELDAAWGLFELMPSKNVVSWTSMINGYVKNRQPVEAFELFWSMLLDEVKPNEFTLVSLLKACTELGSLKLGRWLHDFALKNGFELGIYLGTALVDMYSKCDSLDDARKVFHEMERKSLATWNTMITSLGVHGCGEEALALFAQMEKANVQPDAITFVGVLSACVQTNEMESGYSYFKYMTERYKIIPIQEHYACMIELYSRANMLDEISELVNTMPMKPNEIIAAALLRTSSIAIHGSEDLDKLSYSHDEELNCFGVDTNPSIRNQVQYFNMRDVG